MAILQEVLEEFRTSIPWTYAPLAIFFFFAARCFYRVFLNQLSHIAGPWYTKCSSLWLYYHVWIGDQCTAVHKLHEKYGPILQIAPNDIDIAKGEALWSIYMDNGGFEKSTAYNNFDIDGHPTIFSTVALAKRASRAKAVLPVFSMAAIREATGTITGCADAMVERMVAESKTGEPVNVLNLTRSFALDAVSAYVFQDPYGALEEKSSQLSASPVVDLFVAVGRAFNMPRRLFALQQWVVDTISSNHQTQECVNIVDGYLRRMVADTKQGGSSYQSRLLTFGASKHETAAQCMDVFFAGTDSTGLNLAFICHSLVSHPTVYSKLRKEVQENLDAKAELQSLPYLTGVIKEALRLSLSIACRLPRVVPQDGWEFDGYHIPAGTVVGVSSFELHLNPVVFSKPSEFLPERWEEPTPEMQRDWEPFGKGARGCIARNLALTELFIATEKIIASDVLYGATTVKDGIESYQWYNSRVRGNKIELMWA